MPSHLFKSAGPKRRCTDCSADHTRFSPRCWQCAYVRKREQLKLKLKVRSARKQAEPRKLLLHVQNRRCPICLKPAKLTDDVDHNHKSGLVRGIVHRRCNAIIGVIESVTPAQLVRAFKYLKQEPPIKVRYSSWEVLDE